MFKTDLPRRISRIHSGDEIPRINIALSPLYSVAFKRAHKLTVLSPNNRFIYNPKDNSIEMKGNLITIKRNHYEFFSIAINKGLRSSYFIVGGEHRAVWLVEEKTREFLIAVAKMRKQDTSKMPYLAPYTQDILASSLSIALYFLVNYWDVIDEIYEDSRRLNDFLKMELLL